MSTNPRIPKLRRHPKGSVVVLDGKYFYCGPFGSDESKGKYDRLIAEWLENGRRLPAPESGRVSLSINELILAYWRHVQSYYVKSGKPTSEQAAIKQALCFLHRLFGKANAIDFGPTALKSIRQAMIQHKIKTRVKVHARADGEATWQERTIRDGLTRVVQSSAAGRTNIELGLYAMPSIPLGAGTRPVKKRSDMQMSKPDCVSSSSFSRSRSR